jgi:hypothetical protein
VRKVSPAGEGHGIYLDRVMGKLQALRRRDVGMFNDDSYFCIATKDLI